ncbi:antitoxin VapB family protein [Candidatus Woesearchaeota archaeon]|nr:antitoxin VapB family protein [Candidatus Woesearchaeota archaeon]
MATKTISITEEAYERLKIQKEPKESFTDVINRIAGKRSIMEFAGILSEEEGEKLTQYIKERRKASRERSNKIREMMK